VNYQFHRFLSVLCVVASLVISRFSAAQQAPPPPQPASPGTTVGVVDGPVPRGVRGFPYSADEVTETTQTLADGTHITQKRPAKVYQDSEGRTRREEYFGPPRGTEGQENSPRMVHIFDPVAGVIYYLNPRNHTAHMTELQRPTPPHPPQTTGATANPQPARPDQPRSTHDDLGTQVVEGIEVRGTRTTITIPAGAQGNDQPIQITMESWYSPELHLMMMNTSNDPRRGETVHRITNLVRDEPPAALFQVPPDYTLEETQIVVKPAPGSE
jgi:hypothetical protein